MEDIHFFILKSKFKSVPPEFNHVDLPYTYRPCLISLNDQIKQITGVSISCSIIEYEDIPSNVKAGIICILDENSLIPSDYINRILAINNLHTNACFFCGPVDTIYSQIKNDWFISKISGLYKRYNIGELNHFISCEINNDTINYPIILGNIFIGAYYNAVGGYNPIVSPRGPIYKNPHFFKRLNRVENRPMVYNNRLSTMYFITNEEMEISNFGHYYYTLGYMDGLAANNQSFVDQYIKSNNMLEILDPTWLTQGSTSNNECYKKQIMLLKCHYDIGYAEAFTGAKII